MTTITYDGKHLCADQALETTGGVIKRHIKIHRFTLTEEHKERFNLSSESEIIWAYAGDMRKIAEIHNWLSGNGNLPSSFKEDRQTGTNSGCILAPKTGKIFTLTLNGFLFEDFDKLLTWGAGGTFAMGAMRAGKKAFEAIELTADHTIHAGLGVSVYDLESDQIIPDYNPYRMITGSDLDTGRIK